MKSKHVTDYDSCYIAGFILFTDSTQRERMLFRDVEHASEIDIKFDFVFLLSWIFSNNLVILNDNNNRFYLFSWY